MGRFFQCMAASLLLCAGDEELLSVELTTRYESYCCFSWSGGRCCPSSLCTLYECSSRYRSFFFTEHTQTAVKVSVLSARCRLVSVQLQLQQCSAPRRTLVSRFKRRLILWSSRTLSLHHRPLPRPPLHVPAASLLRSFNSSNIT